MTRACRFCERRFKVRDGVVVFHRQRDVWVETSRHVAEFQWPQPPCPGWGHPPAEEPT